MIGVGCDEREPEPWAHRGIRVGLNWSLLVVAALIAWSLATGILPSAAPGQTSAAYWTAGIVSAFVYLASLLAHELAHSVVAMQRGVRVEGIGC